MTAQRFSDATVDEREVARFAAMAAEWWDPRGRMGMLHKLNPTRLAYIRDTACRHFDRDPKARKCLDGLRVLDIGCGAGRNAVPLAQAGCSVIGTDLSVPITRCRASASGTALRPAPQPMSSTSSCRSGSWIA